MAARYFVLLAVHIFALLEVSIAQEFFFRQSSYTATEADEQLVIEVERTEPFSQPATVDITVVGDIVLTTNQLYFPKNVNVLQIGILVEDNQHAGPDRSAVLTLSNPSIGIIGSPSSTTVTITDDDDGGVTATEPSDLMQATGQANILVENLSDTSFKIVWEPGPTHSDYIIELFEGYEENRASIGVVSNQYGNEIREFTNLNEGTIYEVVIHLEEISNNPYGHRFVRTDPGPVSLMTVTGISFTSATLTADIGNCDTYRGQLICVGTDENTTQNTGAGNCMDDNPVVIEPNDLKPGCHYIFGLRQVLNPIDGLFPEQHSSTFSNMFQTAVIPQGNIVLISVSDTSFTIGWDSAIIPSDYIIELCEGYDESQVSVGIFSNQFGNEVRQFTNLTPGTIYEVKISLVESCSETFASELVSTDPSPISSIAVTDVTSTSATVSFDSNGWDSKKIKRICVCNKNSIVPPETTIIFDGECNGYVSYTDKGLQPNCKYKFIICTEEFGVSNQLSQTGEFQSEEFETPPGDISIINLEVLITDIGGNVVQFTAGLNDRTSAAYFELSNAFTEAISNILRSAALRFLVVNVVRFRPGSVVAEFEVVLDQGSPSGASEVLEILQESVRPSGMIDGTDLVLDPSSIRVLAELCPSDYCKNNGACEVDSVNTLSICRCVDGFSGTQCTIEDKDNAIIVPAMSIVVIVLLVIATFLCCLYCRRRMNQANMAKRRSYGNPYNYGYPVHWQKGARRPTVMTVYTTSNPQGIYFQ